MITLIDFDDSFTFNIYSCLKECFPHIEIEVVPQNRAKSRLQTLLATKKKHVLILGPGPGHPSEYSEFYPVISECIEHPSLFVMGICLGHQLIWNILGFKVVKSNRPIHGQRVEYTSLKDQYIAPWLSFPLSVQRYNSLVVEYDKMLVKKLKNKQYKFYFSHDELIYSEGKNLITYQFHPESIGTYCPAQYFWPLKNHLL